MRFETRVALLIAILSTGVVARGAGLLAPVEPGVGLLEIQNLSVQVEIRDQTAEVRFIQTFKNSVKRELEATYIFPIPDEAAIGEFLLYINGKPVKGEVLDAKKAQAIYEDIVRRARDPALLEFCGKGLLRMRVFPIPANGVQKVEVKYSQTLRFDDNVCHFRFPLRTGQQASKVSETLSCAVSIKSRQPVATIYSPTHKISVSRKGDKEATAGFELERAALDTDFDLYWSLDAKDIGMGLLTHRLKDKDGYFLMMLAPKYEDSGMKILPKDVCFVVDTSGSMEGAKIEGVKKALTHCLNALRADDRFKIVAFSTTVEPQSKELLSASRENVAGALEFVKKIEARGGTDIDGALAEALSTRTEPGRPYLIVFITDGKPTVGRTTETGEIVANVERLNRDNVRIFSFGIDDSINVKLLDLLAERTRGYSEYVRPNKEIEMKVSSFFSKVGAPVFSGLELEFPEQLGVTDVYPRRLPDLFHGMQLIVMGRYRGAGDFAVRLKGKVGEAAKEFVYEGSFPAAEESSNFISDLWALRKIGYLMDQIRLHGEKEELVKEVIRLGREHNIATPYTSFLVLEDAETYCRFGIDKEAAGRGPDDGVGASYAVPHLGSEARFARRGASPAAQEAQKWVSSNLEAKTGGTAGGPRYARMDSGAEGIMSSTVVRQLAYNDQMELKRALEGSVNVVANRRFVRVKDRLVDEQLTGAMRRVQVRWGSPAYFQLARASAEARQCLAQGLNVTLVINNQAVEISENEGREEEFSERELKELLGT